MIVCWWSGGVTSAVACAKAIKIFGLDKCEFVFIDTFNEDSDTYRFKTDCEDWYGKPIKTVSNPKYTDIEQVWDKFLSLNVAHGAICSSELKRTVREQYQKTVDFSHQVFGFDIQESNRARNMVLNYPQILPVFPLLFYGLSKKDCINALEDAGIKIPRVYEWGFHNNNCLKDKGCVQGGMGYWQKMKEVKPDNYYKMAGIEHRLTNMKGKPVTMLKDQGKAAKASGNILVFLEKHPDYPHVKCLADFPIRKVEPLVDCNGFCGTRDGEKSPSANEINFEAVE